MGATILLRAGTVGRNAGNAGRFARGRRQPGKLNKLESAYEGRLESLRRAGYIEWFAFEAIKLRLADNTFYTPDFFVMGADGTLQCHEVKGFWEDDARVKIKVAARLFPFEFIAVKRDTSHPDGWTKESF